MKLILKLAAVLVFGALAFLAYLMATDPGDNLQLLEAELRADPSGTHLVTGAIQNVTDIPYAHVRMEVEVLDAQESVIGSTATFTTNLAAGQTWRFEVPLYESGVAQVRLLNLLCTKPGEEPKPRNCRIEPTLVPLSGQ
jgi:hypothetical protein